MHIALKVMHGTLKIMHVTLKIMPALLYVSFPKWLRPARPTNTPVTGKPIHPQGGRGSGQVTLPPDDHFRPPLEPTSTPPPRWPIYPPPPVPQSPIETTPLKKLCVAGDFFTTYLKKKLSLILGWLTKPRFVPKLLVTEPYKSQVKSK